jgi:hypothetical protein
LKLVSSFVFVMKQNDAQEARRWRSGSTDGGGIDEMVSW